ncbi:MAG: glycosyltransferase family 4 protein [Firmicutes bacterium]|nr:glycosyltransferase family 4 protein [Bacillota bacterium]
MGEYVYQVLTHLSALDPPYQIVLYGDKMCNPETLADLRQTYPVHIVSAVNFFAWEQWAWPRAARHAKLLHGTANIGPLRPSLPYILTVHDVIEWHRGRDFPAEIPLRHHISRVYRMNALKRLAPRALQILTVSEHARQDIAVTLKVPLNRIAVTPLAGKFPLCQPTSGLSDPPFVLTLGALDPRKNLKAVLAGFALVSHPDLTLRIVGVEPRGLPQIMALVRDMGLSQRVVVEAMISDQDLQMLYQRATAFLYLSHYEGFGLPVLEAMSQGCPVICADHASLPEVANDAGILVDPSDSQTVAKHVKTLLSDTEYRDLLRQRGLARARQFSWGKTAELTHREYMKALEEVKR